MFASIWVTLLSYKNLLFLNNLHKKIYIKLDDYKKYFWKDWEYKVLTDVKYFSLQLESINQPLSKYVYE